MFPSPKMLFSLKKPVSILPSDNTKDPFPTILPSFICPIYANEQSFTTKKVEFSYLIE